MGFAEVAEAVSPDLLLEQLIVGGRHPKFGRRTLPLAEYRRKRDFRRTPEPRGKRGRRSAQLSFVVQKHAASHLHYDFRLEVAGVLKSWAVPKGPDLNPAVKRLAMQVEDHPLEYGDFEGVIPKGEYGGGTVLLWDQGTWEPVGDAAAGLKAGRLKFVLHGEKLRGAWMLVRKGGKAATDERAWFLFKERDAEARTGKPITDTMPLSVTTGRDLEEIAQQADRVWGPDGELKKRSGRRTKSGVDKTARKKSNVNERALKTLLNQSGAKPGRLPAAQQVELATLAKQVPEGDDWLYEIKFDGYRMLCRIDDGRAQFISRNGHDWTKKFPELAEKAASLPVEKALLDGEVVALAADGTTSFQTLQNVFQTGRTAKLVYYAFDILHVNGWNVTGVPLEERKEILGKVLASATAQSIRLSEHLEGDGAEIFKQACRMHLEGIICKRRGRPYRPGRGHDWLKVKCARREEFVIGGFTPPTGSRSHFGALLLGYHDADGQLVYSGRVGTGFSDESLSSLHKTMSKLVRRGSPFHNLAGKTGQARGVTWVEPRLVAEIEFSNWTDEGLLRHPSYQGLREDKPASEVVRDVPLSPSEVKAMARAKPASTRRTGGRLPKKGHDSTSALAKSFARRKAADDAELAGVRLSHPDKLLYPQAGVTKLDLAHYYEQVADWLLPQVAGRPLALVRCPGGSGKPCFFQKHPGEGVSPHLRQIDVSETATPEFHLAIDDLAGLIALVQMGVLEIHVWGSTLRHLEKPDRLVFDLDPDPIVPWPTVVAAARELRAVLEGLGLVSFLKTTGGKGLHLVVPIRPRMKWDDAKAFCRAVADVMVKTAPDRYIATASKAARKGKIFIDYLRNGRGATAIAAYSTRAKTTPTVSVPIAWDELSARLTSDHFTIRNLPARLKKLRRDPWADLPKTKQSITAAMLKQLKD
jgi:bifunctional non-homologous end joining protein LigD